MSFDAITWALEHSPVNCPYERLLLTCLARRANADGTDAYPSRRTLASAGLADKSTVTRKLNALEKRGIIREGDQRAAARIPEHLRPKVYDILIPFSYYSGDQLTRVNRERADRGLGPLTAQDRPEIAPAPERKARADKGLKRAPKASDPAPKPARKASRPTSNQEGGASSTPLELIPSEPVSEGGASSTRVLEALEGGASSTPKLSFNSVLSLSPPSPPAPPAEGRATTKTRETAAPEDDPAGPEVPAPRAGEDSDEEQRSELLAMLLALPGRMHRDDAVGLLPLASDAVAAGWTAARLRDHLSRRCDPERVFDVTAIYRKHLKRLPAAQAGTAGHPAAAVPTCGKCNGSGMAEHPETFLPIGPCECRTSRTLTAAL
ncbi:helix-turn-helix domain-containing protein [Streptomyces mirabilis]|uniref:helix-turn-helix domain-containing protein n=1 Tax=Streptomyces mirabilis TaxID=68239 RepID=UPI00365D8762